MELFALKLPLIKKGDPLLEIIISEIEEQGKSLKEGDIVVIAEKVVATSQGRVVSLADVKKISLEAKKLSELYDMDERYVELIIREASMILGGMTHVILAKVNDFLIANAGIDQSNAGPNKVVLLPNNLKKVVWEYRDSLKKKYNLNELGLIIADSRVQPLRKGTIGIAIATAGFEPIEDLIGHPDLFNRPMEITTRAIADDLASAAQFLLSEADQRTPVVIIRDSNVEFTEHPVSTPEMAPEECLYMNIFSTYLLKHVEKTEKETTSTRE
ncbi:MAG TPA: coenzyme F420-0:L-glutamate ligase [Candidatus Nanopelagicaceae bacterium]|nr:coenzyme F420-0:L-glutamate ligase [Candidatus Nanopelagicaceae bacterium]